MPREVIGCFVLGMAAGWALAFVCAWIVEGLDTRQRRKEMVKGIQASTEGKIDKGG